MRATVFYLLMLQKAYQFKAKDSELKNVSIEFRNQSKRFFGQ